MEDSLDHLAEGADAVFVIRAPTETEIESLQNQQGLFSFDVPCGDDLESFDCIHELSKSIGNDCDVNVGLVVRKDDSGYKCEVVFDSPTTTKKITEVESHITDTTTIEEPFITECVKMGSSQSKETGRKNSEDRERAAADSALDTSSAQTAESSEELQQTEATVDPIHPRVNIGLETPFDEDDDRSDNEGDDNAVTGDRITFNRRKPKPRVRYSPEYEAPKLNPKLKKQVPRPGKSKPAVKLEPTTSSSSGLICCPHCPRRFVTYIEYDRHTKRAHIEASVSRTFSCEICGKKYKTQAYIETHSRTHTGERPYRCPHCIRSFTQNGNLQTHIRHMHTGERPYICTVCHKRFLQKSNLDQHFRLHTGVKPYGCDLCGMRFTQGSGLFYHEKNCKQKAC